MGYSVFWLALRGKPRESVLLELQLQGTGERSKSPESKLVGVQLPNDWYLVWKDHPDFPDKTPLAELSRGAEVISCFIEEHAMISSASGWRNGTCNWSILHDSQHGPRHLAIQGIPPEEFGPIRDRLLQAQDSHREDPKDPYSNVDYIFDIPVEMARALTGFRYDSDIPHMDDKPFERLEPV